MLSFCWHKWSKWSEPFQYGFGAMQERYCEKCNKASTRTFNSNLHPRKACNDVYDPPNHGTSGKK